MKQIIEVGKIKIGEGMPKVCVPLVGKNNRELVEEAKVLKELELDIVEWRMDYHEQVQDINHMKESLKTLRELLGDTPLLATFRSKQEGGEREMSSDDYVVLNKTMIESGMIDLIDIELFIGDEIVKELVDFAHEHHVKVVMSNHDFLKTPSKEEIIARLCKMQHLNGDLPKIAVMPQKIEDVLTLLAATHEMATQYANRPIITMSMAEMGVVSRLVGETFGSAVTFAAAKKASAPGQIPVGKLVQILEILHESK